MWLKREKFLFLRHSDLAALISELGRFVTAGLLNTLITIGIYQLTLTLLGPMGAYITAWLAGLVIVSVAYPKVVFRLQTTLFKRFALASQYVAVFLLGIFLLDFLVTAGVHPRIAVLIVVVVNAIVNYTASRFILTRGIPADAAKF